MLTLLTVTLPLSVAALLTVGDSTLRSLLPDPPTFLVDSSLAVTLAPHERALPIVITGSYLGTSHRLTIDDIRSAMVGAVQERKGATYQVIRGGALRPGPAPGVTILVDFLKDGRIRSDVILRCERYDAAHRPNGEKQHDIASAKLRLSRVQELQAHVQELLGTAAALRCPYEALPDGRPVAEDGTGDMATRAVARARKSSDEITRVMVSVDTVRLRVGEKLHQAVGARLIAMREDGSMAREWTPLYAVDDRAIVWHVKGGLEAIAPGATRVTVKAFSGRSPEAMRSAPSASFIVVVTP